MIFSKIITKLDNPCKCYDLMNFRRKAALGYCFGRKNNDKCAGCMFYMTDKDKKQIAKSMKQMTNC